ncbi:MAG: phenylalanine--tRNA ligase subunit alpha [Clostridia bacterium]|nr:phenylalanine--tRNA ligase subunit alpha [Clostridia bacterium]
MQQKINEMLKNALKEIKIVDNKQDLIQVNAKYLGKNGELSSLMRGLKDLSNDQKPKMGAILNEARDKIASAVQNKQEDIDNQILEKQIQNEHVDVTTPVRPFVKGSLHPIELLQRDLIQYFSTQGFTVMDGKEIETDYYCFEALNLPKDHPARDAQDTFYFDAERLLRVHTSATQIRTMESTTPPIKMISTGRTYRVDEVDATHSPMFNQFEILVVDKNVTMSDLKGVLERLAKHLFGEKTNIRLRPSFFPFTEPSVEVDVSCPYCGGKGCNICKQSGFIELLGAGMVQPKVFQNCNVDPNVYTGFAAGLGLDRIAMIKYGISDIRDLYDGDVRFLKQFK